MLTPQRKTHKRAYFFEIFTLLNFIALVVFAWDSRSTILGSVLNTGGFAAFLLTQLLIGLAVRSTIAVVRRDKTYFRIVRSRGWITDTVRLIVAGSLASFTYSFVKLLVPLYHPRLFDQDLWDLDQMLFFGMSPNIFFLDVFSQPYILRIVDWSYAKVFLASNVLAFGYFLSAPSRRVRMAFATGNLMMWLFGGWLYMLVPSLGPAYRFPDVWLAHGRQLGLTQYYQALLMKNYQTVLRSAAGIDAGLVNPILGIGAFPSLHVGFQALVSLWMRKLWTWGEVIFATFVIVIFLGSIITGWHYMVDGLAGIVLAFVCYASAARAFRFDRWTRLFRALQT